MTSPALEPRWGQGPQPLTESACWDDTADQAAAAPGQVHTQDGWSPRHSPLFPTRRPGSWDLRFFSRSSHPTLSPTPSLWWSEGGKGRPSSATKPSVPHAGSQSSAPSVHNSHAAGGPLGNRQSSGSYGSFKSPFLPNNPSSGVVLIPCHWQPLGMPRPSLGWINRCAVIFTQQLPALIPLLPAPATGPLLTDNTPKAGPAGTEPGEP